MPRDFIAVKKPSNVGEGFKPSPTANGRCCPVVKHSFQHHGRAHGPAPTMHYVLRTTYQLLRFRVHAGREADISLPLTGRLKLQATGYRQCSYNKLRTTHQVLIGRAHGPAPTANRAPANPLLPRKPAPAARAKRWRSGPKRRGRARGSARPCGAPPRARATRSRHWPRPARPAAPRISR